MTQEEAIQRLNVEVDLIPSSASNRPGTRIEPRYITIHNTGNSSASADARMHARYVKGADARARKVSWHFTVDDNRCIKHLPTSEKAWHAGPGNSQSIAIEVCEHAGIDHEAAADRASLLAATLMLALGIPPERVVPHQHWTGKDCPRVLLRQEGGFAAFRERTAEYLEQLHSGPAGDAADAALATAPLAVADTPAGTQEPALFDTGAAPETARLERLVGKLMAENERLREALDLALEAE